MGDEFTTGEIRLSLVKSERRLSVHVAECRNLAAKDSSGSSDPYVVIKCCGSKKKSKVKKQTLEPVYNVTWTFDLPERVKATEAIEVSVYDWDFGLNKDDFIGSVWLPLRTLGCEFEALQWLFLRPKNFYDRGQAVQLNRHRSLGAADTSSMSLLANTIGAVGDDARESSDALVLQAAADSGGAVHGATSTFDSSSSSSSSLSSSIGVGGGGARKLPLSMRPAARKLISAERLPVSPRGSSTSSPLSRSLASMTSMSAADRRMLTGQLPAVANESKEAKHKRLADESGGKFAYAGEISLKLHYLRKERLLMVGVNAARRLDSKDKNGSSDPYCEVRLGKQRKTTKRLRKTLNPVFNQEFTFVCTAIAAHTLFVAVWDWDRVGSNDYIGGVSVPLDSLRGELEQWFDLNANHGQHLDAVVHASSAALAAKDSAAAAAAKERIALLRVNQVHRLAALKQHYRNMVHNERQLLAARIAPRQSIISPLFLLTLFSLLFLIGVSV
jgi:C2 domain